MTNLDNHRLIIYTDQLCIFHSNGTMQGLNYSYIYLIHQTAPLMQLVALFFFQAVPPLTIPVPHLTIPYICTEQVGM